MSLTRRGTINLPSPWGPTCKNHCYLHYTTTFLTTSAGGIEIATHLYYGSTAVRHPKLQPNDTLPISYANSSSDVPPLKTPKIVLILDDKTIERDAKPEKHKKLYWKRRQTNHHDNLRGTALCRWDPLIIRKM